MDLVITDIRMPEMDGIALMKNLNTQLPTLSVIAASGYADKSEIEVCDFDGFAEKPQGNSRLSWRTL